MKRDRATYMGSSLLEITLIDAVYQGNGNNTEASYSFENQMLFYTRAHRARWQAILLKMPLDVMDTCLPADPDCYFP